MRPDGIERVPVCRYRSPAKPRSTDERRKTNARQCVNPIPIPAFPTHPHPSCPLATLSPLKGKGEMANLILPIPIPIPIPAFPLKGKVGSDLILPFRA